MPVNQYTPGINYPAGFQVANPFPLDAYLGPYPGGTTTDARNSANNTISPVNRYQGMQVILLAPDGGQTRAYKYWYRGGTGNTDLVEFSSEGGGGIVGDYVTTFNGRTGAVQGVSAALAGDGIAVSAATGSVTITNIGVTYISAGSFISVSGNTGTVTVTNIGVHSFNGRTGAVAGASLGANTFSELNTFNAGISASGATLGTLVVNSGISAAGGITFNSTANFTAGLSASGATFSTVTVNSGATVGGRLDVGGVLDVVSGATFESTIDVSGIARFVSGISAAGSTFQNLTVRPNGGLIVQSGGYVQVSGNILTSTIRSQSGASFESGIDVSGSLGRFFNGLSANSGSFGTVSTTGQATLNSLSVTNNASVGGTLDVLGNLYVQGTVTTVNETQLLIQDKFLVLGSTTGSYSSSLADGAGLYVGATVGANAIAGICYSHSGNQWSSSHAFNIPTNTSYRIGGVTAIAETFLGSAIAGSSLTSVGTISIGVWQGTTIGLTYGGTNKNLASSVSGGVAYRDSTGIDVTSAGTDGQYLRSSGSNAPTWASFSALTGLTADRVKTTATNASGTYYLTFVTGAANSTDLYVDTTTGITFDPATDTLSCVKIEAIVDGGTW